VHLVGFIIRRFVYHFIAWNEKYENQTSMFEEQTLLFSFSLSHCKKVFKIEILDTKCCLLMFLLIHED